MRRRYSSRVLVASLLGGLGSCVQQAPTSTTPAADGTLVTYRAHGDGPEAGDEPPAQGPRSWLGVRFDARVPKVVGLIPGAPAERAGLRVDDEVVALDGQPAGAARDLVREIGDRPAGATVTLGVKRDGALLELTVVVETRPSAAALVRLALLDKPAPIFSAELVRGSYPAALAELAGKVVVVDFWATWCAPCLVSMSHLDAWQAKYGPRGLRIVGLSSEGRDEIARHFADSALDYTIARDADDKIARDYLVPGLPTLVIIDKAGIVRHVQLGAGNFAAVEAAIVRLL